MTSINSLNGQAAIVTAELSQSAFLLKVDCLGNEEHTYTYVQYMFFIWSSISTVTK